MQDRPSTDQAAIVSAVAAERERTGAHVLAEGIETEAHVAVARDRSARRSARAGCSGGRAR